MPALATAFAWPAGQFLSHRAFQRRPTLWFVLIAAAILGLGLSGSGTRPLFAYSILFLWCLSFSVLNYKAHCEKWEVLEGRIGHAETRSPFEGLRTVFLIAVHLCLLWSMALVLQQAAALAPDALFIPSRLGLMEWSLYALDLVLKALLFDIPEIYGIDVIHIEHVGFWGSSLVFLSRLVVLILILGSALRIFKLRQWMWESLMMLARHPQIAQTRLLLLVQMYPRYLRHQARICRSGDLPPEVRAALLETMGKTGQAEVIPTFEYFLEHGTGDERLAALRGFEHLKQGRVELIEGLLSKEEALPIKLQACKTLGAWRDPKSTAVLCDIAVRHSLEEVRLAAITALGENRLSSATEALLGIVTDQGKGKEERFHAKDALVAIGSYSAEIAQLPRMLLESPHVDYRRFAAIILGGIPDIASLPSLLEAMPAEEDPDTRVYIAKAIGAIAAGHRVSDLSASALEVLLRATDDGHPFVRAASLYALGQMGDTVAADPACHDRVHECLKRCNSADDGQTAEAAAEVWERLSWALSPDFKFAGVRPPITVCGIEDLRSPAPQARKQSRATSTLRPTPGTLHAPGEQVTAASAGDAAAGTQVISGTPSRYLPSHMVWQGMFSQILRVYDSADGREKALHRLSGEDLQSRELFLHEIEILRGLSHPNILSMLEAYPDYDPPCFTMPFVETGLLSDELQRRKDGNRPWSATEILILLNGICDAVDYLHRNFILHLDLKPGNIFYREGRVVLFDFNIAQRRPRDLRQYLYLPPRARRGTPFYMAPEQYYGGRVDFQSDVYGLGIIAYELLTSCVPFGVKPGPVQRPDVAPEIYGILARSTHPVLEERYESAALFRESLAAGFNPSR